MATVEELSQALKRADAAGDTQAASKLAAALQKTPQTPAVNVVEGAREAAGGMTREEVMDEFSGGVRGVGETAATFGSGMLSMPAAGVAGAAQGIYNLIRDGDDETSAAERVRQVQEKFTYQPRTEQGKRLIAKMGAPFQKLHEGAVRAGEATLGATGSPAAATAVQTGVEFSPALLGVRAPRQRIRQRRQDVQRVERSAEEAQFDLDAPADIQRQQIAGAGERATGGQRSQGEPFPQINEAVRRARNEAKQQVDELYKEARSTEAMLPVSEARQFPDMARASLKDFDIQDMPVVMRRLQEIERVKELPSGSSLKLSRIEDFRKRINKNRPARSDRAQNAALDVLKAQVDNFMEAKFHADMLKGDPTTIAKWQNARDAFRQFRKTFEEDKFIKQMADQQATPAEMRQWLFGASLTGAKKEAQRTVGRLKKILGEESGEMTALRQDALLDIMEPLLRDEPKLGQFVKNYDRLVMKNKPLAEELFPQQTRSALKDLRDFASATGKRMEPTQMVDLSRMGAVALFGHGISRAAMKVSLARRLFGMVMAGKNKNARHQILSEVLGYDPEMPLLNRAPAMIGGTAETAKRQAN